VHYVRNSVNKFFLQIIGSGTSWVGILFDACLAALLNHEIAEEQSRKYVNISVFIACLRNIPQEMLMCNVFLSAKRNVKSRQILPNSHGGQLYLFTRPLTSLGVGCIIVNKFQAAGSEEQAAGPAYRRRHCRIAAESFPGADTHHTGLPFGGSVTTPVLPTEGILAPIASQP
jgi:hypothetical protein